MTVNVGGDNLSVPLGSTKDINVMSLLDTEESGFFKQMDDGAYVIRFADNVDISENLPALGDLAGISPIYRDIPFEEQITGISNMSYSGTTVGADVDLYLPEINMDELEQAFPDAINVHNTTMVPFSDFSISREQAEFFPPGTEQPVSKDIHLSASSAVNVRTSIGEYVDKINTISFVDGSRIEITIDRESHPLWEKLNTEITELEIHFPDVMIMPSLTDNVFRISSAENFNAKLTFSIPVSGMDLSACSLENGYVHILDMVQYSLTGHAAGNVVPSDLVDIANSKVSLDITPVFSIEDIDAHISEISEPIGPIDKDMVLTLDGDFSEGSTYTIYPKGSNSLRINLDMPTMPFEILTDNQGVKIILPQMFDFDAAALASYNFSSADNSIVIRNRSLPSSIVLPFNSMTISPVQVSGKTYRVDDSFAVEGRAYVPSQSVKASELESIQLKPVKMQFVVPALEMDRVETKDFSFNFGGTYDLNINANLDKAVKSVSSIILASGDIDLSFEITRTPVTDSQGYVDLTINLPKQFVFEDARVSADNVVTVKNQKLTRNGSGNYGFSIGEPLVIKKMILQPENIVNGALVISEPVSMDGVMRYPELELNMDAMSGGVKGNLAISVENIRPKTIYGVVDYVTDPVEKPIELEDLPDMLTDEGTVLDLVNPHLLLSISSNMGIPVKGDLLLRGFDQSGAPIGTPVPVSLSIPMSEDLNTVVTKYYIGGSSASVPGDYTYLEADLKGLIKRLPSKIQVTFNASIVTEGDEHVIRLLDDAGRDVQYTAALDYEFIVPLAFGDEFKIDFEQFIEMKMEEGNMLLNLLNDNKLFVGGTIVSNIPMQLVMSVAAVDMEKNPLPIRSNEQTIKSCNSDGTPSTSDLALILENKGEKVTAVGGLILRFEATCGSASGLAITDASTLKADLHFKADGGITIDLNGMNKTEEEQ